MGEKAATVSSSKQIALVMGNGPSIDQLDPSWLPQFYTYGSNHIGKKFAAWGVPTDAVVITDSNRLVEIRKSYQNYGGKLYVGDQRCVLPAIRHTKALLGRDFVPLRQLTKPRAKRIPGLSLMRIPSSLQATVFDKVRFSFSMEKGFNFGYSVITTAIQLAVIDGFKTILLTGVDANYTVPKSYFKGAEESVSYVNHAFIESPRLWLEPILVNLQIYLEELGVRLADCTPNGRLRFIEKASITDFLSEGRAE